MTEATQTIVQRLATREYRIRFASEMAGSETLPGRVLSDQADEIKDAKAEIDRLQARVKELEEKPSVPMTLADFEQRAFDHYRDTLAGIMQGNCEECGNCDDDADGNCACDRIVNSMIDAIARIDEEADTEARAVLQSSGK